MVDRGSLTSNNDDILYFRYMKVPSHIGLPLWEGGYICLILNEFSSISECWESNTLIDCYQNIYILLVLGLVNLQRFPIANLNLTAQPNEELPQPKMELFFKCIKKNCINSFFFLFLSFSFLLFYLKILSLPSKSFQKQEGFVIYTTQQLNYTTTPVKIVFQIMWSWYKQ